MSQLYNLVINATPAQDSFRNRGIGRYTVNLISEITQLAKENDPSIAGFNKIIIIGYRNQDSSFVTLSDKVSYFAVDTPIINRSIIKTFVYTVLFNSEIEKIFKESRESGIKSIYFLPRHLLPTHPMADSTVKMVHDLIPLHMENFSNNPIINFLLKKEYLYHLNSLRNTEIILTNSEFSKADIVAQGIPKEKITSIPLASALFRLFTPKMYNNRPISEDYFIYYGGYDANKNLPRIIEAFHLFVEKTKSNTKLVLSGGINHTSFLTSIAERFNISAHIISLPVLSDLELVRYLIHSKGLVRLSLLEGFGLPELEAMSLGVPVITSSEGPGKEYFEKYAMLHKPTDVMGVTESLKILAIKGASMEYLKKAQGYAKSFTWKRTTKDTLEKISQRFIL